MWAEKVKLLSTNINIFLITERKKFMNQIFAEEINVLTEDLTTTSTQNYESWRAKVNSVIPDWDDHSVAILFNACYYAAREALTDEIVALSDDELESKLPDLVVEKIRVYRKLRELDPSQEWRQSPLFSDESIEIPHMKNDLLLNHVVNMAFTSKKLGEFTNFINEIYALTVSSYYYDDHEYFVYRIMNELQESIAGRSYLVWDNHPHMQYLSELIYIFSDPDYQDEPRTFFKNFHCNSKTGHFRMND